MFVFGRRSTGPRSLAGHRQGPGLRKHIDGDVLIYDSGRDILFGDPTPGADCAPNTRAERALGAFEDNSTDIEFNDPRQHASRMVT